MSEGNIVTELLDEVVVVDGRNRDDFRLRGEWRYSQKKLLEVLAAGEEIVISKAPFRPNHVKRGGEPKKLKNLLSVAHYGTPTYEDASEESRALFGSEAFDYPKPEKLIATLIAAVTEPGDWVLDSFAGSGTTGAVAHKLGLRWIMVELGEHATTLIAPRLQKVIDGNDPGGITGETGWAGGGGFRFQRLAPSMLERDKYGNWIVSKQYNPEMLAAAMCKHEGFTYSPSDEVYWQHGRSTETDFVYVTTQTLGRKQLAQLSEEVGPDRTLLVCCGAFRANLDEFPNLTIKKIPNAVLDRCEWGRDDYSLAVAHLPDAQVGTAEAAAAESPAAATPWRRGRRKVAQEPELFEESGS
jgi:adenine-specific DNA-methyltransferase